MEPTTYPRRILLAVTGLSPQIVTETLYALAVDRDPPFVPTEVHLLTTAEGAERARLSLLSDDPGWFGRLQRDYALPPIAFGPDQVQVLRDESGRELDDIRTLSDNQLAAPYLIHGDGARPKTRFGLRLDPEAIRYAPIDAEGSPGAQPGEPA